MVKGLPLTVMLEIIYLKHELQSTKHLVSFMKEIFKLHGLPKAIVSDRDVKFTFNFWKGLFAYLGTKLNFSIAYHPQIEAERKI